MDGGQADAEVPTVAGGDVRQAAGAGDHRQAVLRVNRRRGLRGRVVQVPEHDQDVAVGGQLLGNLLRGLGIVLVVADHQFDAPATGVARRRQPVDQQLRAGDHRLAGRRLRAAHRSDDSNTHVFAGL